MVFLFWFIYLAAQRERGLSVSAQDWAQRPPALLTTLASVIYQERSSGDPHKAICSHYWINIFKTPHFTKQGFTQSITKLVCTAFRQACLGKEGIRKLQHLAPPLPCLCGLRPVTQLWKLHLPHEDQTILHVRLCQD